MAAIIRIGLRSNVLSEARSAFLAASSVPSRLFSAAGSQRLGFESKPASLFTPVSLPSYTQHVSLIHVTTSFTFYRANPL